MAVIDVPSWLPGLLGPVTWKENGTAKAARAILNFVGVTITDDGSQLTFTVNPSSPSGLAAGIATWLATPSSANLRAAMTDETGSGALMFAPTGTGLPHIVAGVLQAASSLLVNADVDPAAAIALSKLAPIVATENIATAGVLDDLALATASTVPITMVRLTDAGALDLTGVAGGASGRIVILLPVGAGGLTVRHENAGSTADNRILIAGAADFTVVTDAPVVLLYDSTTARWRAGILRWS